MNCIDHGCKGYGIGYATAWITIEGKKLPTTKHRRVFYETHGYLPEVVMHTCDNPRCINPDHLKAGTYVENMQDCKRKGRLGDARNFAAANGRTKITPIEAACIRKLRSEGTTLSNLAKEFGIGITQVGRIVRMEHHVQLSRAG